MNKLALFPVIAQVALTFGLLLAMGGARVRAVREGRVRVPDIALGQPAWPVSIMRFDRAYHNQLELPLILMGAVALSVAMNALSPAFVVCEWIYVGLRFAHAYVHVASNNLRHRFVLFTLSLFPLAALWLLLAWRVYAVD